jgi:hypothetical protein
MKKIIDITLMEMQFQTTIICHLTIVRIAIFKKAKGKKCWW